MAYHHTITDNPKAHAELLLLRVKAWDEQRGQGRNTWYQKRMLCSELLAFGEPAHECPYYPVLRAHGLRIARHRID